jgi:hypothetical protein
VETRAAAVGRQEGGVAPRRASYARPPDQHGPVLRVILAGVGLRRDAYLRMVLAPDGVADGAMVVGAVYFLLAVPGIVRGAALPALVWSVIGGVFGWLVLSGLVYLAGRYVLEGDGTFPGVAAASSLAFPPLLLALGLRPVLDSFAALLAASVWSLACAWQAARVALELAPARSALAVAVGYGGWLLLASVSSL